MFNFDRVKELQVDEWIWLVFIILSILNILGDKLEEDYCITKQTNKKNTSRKIFIFTVFISLIIYLYLEYQRYYHYKEAKIKQENTSLWELRCFGGFLVIIATLIFLYCQVTETSIVNPGIV